MSQAREIRADQAAEEIIEVADTEPDAQLARVKVEARKWYAGEMNRQRYGNQVDVNQSNRRERRTTASHQIRRAHCPLIPNHWDCRKFQDINQ